MSRSTKREDVMSWHEYFMQFALLAAKRSKDPKTQNGACIVNNKNIIVGVGYNGFPRGCSDDEFTWAARDENPADNKHFYVCHAEMNAIVNKNCSQVENFVLYTTQFPCNECAKIIIQSGIRRVIYGHNEDGDRPINIASARMFKAAKVDCILFSDLNVLE